MPMCWVIEQIIPEGDSGRQAPPPCQKLTQLCARLWFPGARKGEYRVHRGDTFINAHEAILMANRLHRWVLAAALPGLAGGVLAQTGSSSAVTPSPAGGPGWHQHRHHGEFGFIMRSFHDLDLTAAQKEQVHTILSAARQQHEAERAAGAPTMRAFA